MDLKLWPAVQDALKLKSPQRSASDLQAVASPTPTKREMKVIQAGEITNVDRHVGCQLGHLVTTTFGEDVPSNSVMLKFTGHAGQSFGAFLAKGVTFELTGDANDYTGKGLSGGGIILKVPPENAYNSWENVIGGNANLYGATGGFLYGNGIFAERFAVRNSGATAVVEGVGDHGCEYMTRGLVVILGAVGKNFAAGMSDGIAYLYEPDQDNINTQMVYVERVTYDDKRILHFQISEHVRLTGSKRGQAFLADWEAHANKFHKVFPMDYKRVIKDALMEHVMKNTESAQAVLNDFEDMRLTSAGATYTARERQKQEEQMRSRYKAFRAKGEAMERTRSVLPALGLGDISPFMN